MDVKFDQYQMGYIYIYLTNNLWRYKQTREYI